MDLNRTYSMWQGGSAVAPQVMIRPENKDGPSELYFPRRGHEGSQTLRCSYAHTRGSVPIVGTALALAKGTAGVGPAGKADRAKAAKSEALVPWAQGMTQHEVKRLPHARRQVRAQDTVERGQGQVH